MRLPKTLSILLVAAPLAAVAQTSVTQARIVGQPPTYRDDLRVCLDRGDSLADRKMFLDRERLANEQEGRDIAREGARLAQELRGLDAGNASAIAAYNARQAEHNLRVEAHNRRIGDMNAAVASLNGDVADQNAYCNVWASRLR